MVCFYRGQSHYSINCNVVTDIEARKQSLRKSGRCSTCLHKGTWVVTVAPLISVGVAVVDITPVFVLLANCLAFLP